MNERQASIAARFRARSLERIRKTALSLLELEEGRGGPDVLLQVVREIHTLKGDGRVLGFGRLSEIAHEAEERLAHYEASEGGPPPAACAQIRGALDVLTRYLLGQLGDDDSANAILLDTKRRLSADHPQQASAEPSSAPERETSTPAAAGEDEKDGSGQLPSKRGSERWMQVSTRRVNELCDRISDFATEFRSLCFRLSTSAATSNASARALGEEFDRCRCQLDEVMATAWSLRLVPIEPTLSELVRYAKETAREQGKRLRVLVQAGGELERGVLDELWEPLLHLVRNAVAHGIELPEERVQKSSEASLTLAAEPVGSNLRISIADDGRGIDVALVRTAAVARGLMSAEAASALSDVELFELLFTHGFSTKTSASELSGRGVGLDIVRSRMKTLGGDVTVSSQAGQGTRFDIVVPATVSKERALVLECSGVLYALPGVSVIEVVRLADQRLEKASGGAVLQFRDEMLPLRSFASSIGLNSSELEPRWAVIVQSAGRHWAFGIEERAEEHGLLRRPVDPLLARFDHLAGSGTLEDGRLVLLVSVADLLRRAETERGAAHAGPALPAKRCRILVVDDSPIVRDVLLEILSDAGIDGDAAPDGEVALEMIAKTQPDLVLTDLEMPNLDGFGLLQGIRSNNQKLPVIVLTTRGSAEDRRRAASLGADAYLVKSDFEGDSTLLNTIRHFAGGRK